MRNLIKKEKGFTLIEIVLVLAIAGLLLVIVFLAVSGAQKSRRDTQRKTDLSRLAAALENYASNTNGAYPSSLSGTAFAPYLPSNFESPETGNAYGFGGTVTAPVKDSIAYSLSGRTYTVCIGLEQGFACRNNQ